MRLKKDFTLVLLAFFMAVRLLVLAIANPPKPAQAGERYVSEWRYVDGGEVAKFWHGLEVRPVDVHVWVALHVLKADSAGKVGTPVFSEVAPHTDLGEFRVQTVNPEFVSLVNLGDSGYYVQVVAER